MNHRLAQEAAGMKVSSSNNASTSIKSSNSAVASELLI